MTGPRQTLDITRELCPMTLVKVLAKLRQMDPGTEVDVLMKAGEPLENVPRSVKEHGHEVLSITEETEGVYRVSLRKKAE